MQKGEDPLDLVNHKLKKKNGFKEDGNKKFHQNSRVTDDF